MNYASHVNKVKSFILDYSKKTDISELLNNPLSELKETAYYLFDELITITPPIFFQEPHPIVELFKLIEQSLSPNLKVEKALLEHLETWWVEWHFVATMNAKLLNEHNDPQQKYLIAHTHHPMRNHELSHYAKLFTVLPMPICNVCVETGDILKVNQRYIDVFGFTINDTPNVDIWWEKAYPDIDKRNAARALWNASLAQAESNKGDIPANDYQITCKNGEQVIMQVSGINIGNEFSRVKLANCQLSLIIIDIDNFKKFNDRYGHIAGDKCLYAVAQKLADTVSRPEDFVARYGGEEFVVLLPQTDKQGALFVAEQIQKAIEMLAIVHEDSFTGYLSVSMGINTVNHHQCDDHLTFIQAADDALYYAKNQGRNCIALSPGK